MKQPDEKPKAMLKHEDGFIMSKRQISTWKDGLIWQSAKSPGVASGLDAAAEIFEEHGYEVVEWDDDHAG